jgi:hypothetical protein
MQETLLSSYDKKILLRLKRHFGANFQDTHQLIHGGGGRCLDSDPNRSKVYLRQCDTKSDTQRWTIEKVNQAAMEKWNKL